MDIVASKTTKTIFNLMSNMQARKDVEKNASMSRTSGKIFKERPWEPRPKCEFTSLGEPLETIFNILL